MHSKSLNFIYKIKQFSGDMLLGSFDCINAIFGITLHSNIVYIQLACQNNNCLVNCFLCLGKDVGIDFFHIGKRQNPLQSLATTATYAELSPIAMSQFSFKVPCLDFLSISQAHCLKAQSWNYLTSNNVPKIIFAASYSNPLEMASDFYELLGFQLSI